MSQTHPPEVHFIIQIRVQSNLKLALEGRVEQCKYSNKITATPNQENNWLRRIEIQYVETEHIKSIIQNNIQEL